MASRGQQVQNDGRPLVVGRIDSEGKFHEEKPLAQDTRVVTRPGGTVTWVYPPEGYDKAIAVKFEGMRGGPGYNIVYDPKHPN